MVKLMGMLKRKDDITPEEYYRYWHDVHAPLVLKMVPGIIKYIQNHAVRLSSGGEPQFDGVAEVWFEDLVTWRKFSDLYLSEAGKPIRDDEDNFLNRKKMVFLVVEEKVIK